MSDQQLKDHYQSCIQLVSSGKVSAKNAFSLHLIDVMTEVLSSCNKESFFQMAGCTLDAGAKIYSFRVDNLHSDAYRVANVLGTNKRDDDLGNDENINSNIEENMEDEVPAVLKKKRKRNFKCITSDLNKIHKRVSYNVEHDALYQKASKVIGDTKPTDLLSLRMPVTDSERKEKIVIDGSSKVSFTRHCLEGSHFPMIPRSILNLPNPKVSSQVPLCLSVDDILRMLDVNFTHTEDESQCEFDEGRMHRFLNDVNANFAHDVDAPPMPEEDLYTGDNGACDGFDETMRHEPADQTFGVAPHSVLSGTEYDIGNESNFYVLEPSLPNLLKHVQPGEFLNFSDHVLGAFFGRKQLKTRNEKPGPKKTKSSPENVIVQYETKIVQYETNYLMAASTKNRALTTLSHSKGETRKNSCAAYSRAEYEKSNWTSYFELDLDFVKSNSMSEPVNMELQDYNYNNPLDASNTRLNPTGCNDADDYADDMGNYDDDDDMPNLLNPDDDAEALDNMPPASEDLDNLGDLNLVDAPVYAEQFKINYAKRAKNVDVRKVKFSMLNYLKDHDNQPEVSKLTSLLRNARRTLKPVVVRDLSLHVAFVTLLDLANEQKLQLCNNEDFTEVLVKFAAAQ